MSNSLADLAINLTANIAGFVSDMGRAEREANKRTKSIAREFKQLATTVAGALTIREITGFVKSAIDAADRVRDLSKSFGVGVQQLSAFKLIAEQSGTSLESVARGMNKLAREAVANNEAFAAIGVSTRDANGDIKDLDKLIAEVAEKFEGYKDGAEKVALAQALFGKSGAELIPLLNEGAKGIAEMTDKAKSLGVVIGDDLADQSDRFNDNMSDMGGLVQGLANDFATALLPSLNSFTELLVQNGIEARKGAQDHNVMADAIKYVISGLVIAKNALESVFDVLFFGGQILHAAQTAWKTLGNVIQTVASAQLKAMAGDFKGAWQTMQSGLADAGENIRSEFNAIRGGWEAVKSGFKNNTNDVANAFEALWSPAQKAGEAVEEAGNAGKKAAPKLKTLGDEAFAVAKKLKPLKDEMNSHVEVHRKWVKEITEASESLTEMLLPLKGIESQYQRDKVVLEQAIQLRQNEGKTTDDLVQALAELKRKRDEDTEAVRRQMNPVDSLIQDLEAEIKLMGLGNIERQREIALRNLGATATDEQKRALDALLQARELEGNKGLFGSSLDANGMAQSLQTFEDLLGSSIDSAFRDGISGGLQILGRGLKEGFKDFQSGAQSIGSIASFLGNAVNQFRENPDAPLRAITNIAAQIPGVVGAVAQAIQAVDSLFGGRLLGTNYERQSSSISINLGQGGFTGQNQLVETRQRSFFRGTSTRRTNSPIDANFQSQLDQFFEAMRAAVGQAARALATDVGPLITGAFKQEFDKNGNLVRQFSTVMGRVFNESVEAFQQRITAENLLDVLQRSIGSGSEISQIAEQWRTSAAKLLEGAQFLLVAQGAINAGTGLLGDGAGLSQTTEFVQSLNQAGETLSQTFERLMSASNMFEDALSIMGQSLDLSREEFVTFAAEIADAAGGLERASQLWQTYFDTFYNAEERIQIAISQARQSAGQMLGELGFEDSVTLDQFRAAFEQALPTLDAEEMAQWLRAGEAIAQVSQAESQLAEIRSEEAAAARELQDVLASLNPPATEFGQDISDITLRMRDLTEQANALARESGRAGASQEELAEITGWASRQYAMAIDRLRERVSSLAAELYGTELQRIESEIEALQNSSSSDTSGIDAVAQANNQRYEQELQYIKSIRDFVRSLRLSELSPLNAQQRFGEAQSQFRDLLGRAQGGDLEALAQLQQSAQALLQEGRSFLGPSDQFTDLFESVTAALSALMPTGSPGSGGPGVVSIVPSEELNALFARREELLLEQENRQREALAEALATQIGELAAAQRQSAIEIADQMGISLSDLVTDLGISLDDLSVSTAQELAAVAATLNLSVSDLANAVGASLGELTETNSILNDAFEAEIAELPSGIQDQLNPLLRAVEEAVTEADANAAINILRTAVDALPPGLRDQLAPFLGLGQSFAEPIESMQDVIEQYGQLQVQELIAIRVAIQELATVGPVGTTTTTVEEQVTELQEIRRGITRLVEIFDREFEPRVIAAIGTANQTSGGQTNQSMPSGSNVESLLRTLIEEVKTGTAKQVNATTIAANKYDNARAK